MIKFKSDKAYQRLLDMHPICIMILGGAAAYCLEKQLPFVVTETMTTPQEDKDLDRVSDTHRTGRAFDVSVNLWRASDISQFVSAMDAIYGSYGAQVGDKKSVIIYHDSGHGSHFHFQVNRKYSVKELST